MWKYAGWLWALVALAPLAGPGFSADSASQTVQQGQNLRVKASPKNLRLRALPGSPGKLDREAVLIDVCSARAEPFDRLDASHKTLATEVIVQLKADNTEQANAAWRDLVRSMGASEAPINLDSVIIWVMRDAYLDSLGDLQFYADRVGYFNDLKQSIRSQLRETRAALSRCEVPDAGCEARTIADARRFVKSLESELATTGGDAQRARHDLQARQQGKRQIMNTLANAVKLLHDTAAAVLRGDPYCGDGACTGGESSTNCPADCAK